MVIMAPYKNMPDDLKKMAEETEAAIRDGKLNLFKCPVVKQDGTTVECKGSGALSDEQVLGMNFYVKGIDDKLGFTRIVRKSGPVFRTERCAAWKGEHRWILQVDSTLGPML